MSRVGKQPINIPENVKVSINGDLLVGSGPNGKLELRLPRHTAASLEGQVIRVSRSQETAEGRSMHGLARALVNNLIQGVSVGFRKRLEIQGVGFKAQVQGSSINLSLGFSHPISYKIPSGVKIVVEENTKIIIDGPSKELVGKAASEIRSYYPPEPYKGKGVRYSDEKVIRKEGKTVQ